MFVWFIGSIDELIPQFDFGSWMDGKYRHHHHAVLIRKREYSYHIILSGTCANLLPCLLAS